MSPYLTKIFKSLVSEFKSLKVLTFDYSIGPHQMHKFASSYCTVGQDVALAWSRMGFSSPIFFPENFVAEVHLLTVAGVQGGTFLPDFFHDLLSSD